jgi:hypothetical protein
VVRGIRADVRRPVRALAGSGERELERRHLASAVGGVGLIGAVPAQVVRIETNNTTTATTSFCIIEHASR